MIPTLVVAAAPPADLGLNPWVALTLGIFLVFLNGFFVAAEFALVKVRSTQIAPLAEAGDRRAKVAKLMITHLDAYLSATQLGITLASLALGWIGEPAFAWVIEPVVMKIPGATEAWVGPASIWTAFVIITILHIVLGELTPKSLAIRKPQATTIWIAVPLFLFYKLTFPAIWVLNHAANFLLRQVGIEPISEHDGGHDEEELRLLVASGSTETIDATKRELLDNIFELSHRVARQVMVPRADVVYLSTERGLDENLALARRSGHTRFPLCAGDLDKVIGMVHIKDLFQKDGPIRSLNQFAREMAMVPETLTLDRLLQRMLSEKVHQAAVLDEYGGVSGIVTLENVIEEIVGEIQDEFDAERPDVIPSGENTYLVAGSVLVADLEDEIGIEFSDRDEDTLGGVVLSELGRQPKPGDRTEVGPLSIEIVDVHLNRIRTLRVTKQVEATDEAS